MLEITFSCAASESIMITYEHKEKVVFPETDLCAKFNAPSI